MITKEFREWVETIKESVKTGLEGIADVTLGEYDTGECLFAIHVVVKNNGPGAHMSFDQSEYYGNDKEQRCELVKTRCGDMADIIENEASVIVEVVEKLQAI